MSALEYLYRFTNYENMGRYNYSRSTFDLKRMRDMLGWCGHPDREIPLRVHIAGTKGKGSTALLTSAIIQAAGAATGVYTSPHLEDIRERIAINGEWITEANLAQHIESLKEYLELPRETPPPTFFDIITTIALREFARQECDAAVLEVGLGGRLDSTNVIEPTITAITTVHYDHMDKLGDQLSQIAGEKAGILKPGIPAIIGKQLEEAANTIQARIDKLGIDSWWLGREIRIEPDSDNTVCIVTPQRTHPQLVIAANGRHQQENAAVAVGICDWLDAHQKLQIADEHIRSALATTQPPGRVELFDARLPRVILDSAHNAISASALRDALGAFSYGRLHLVLGIASDKTVETIVEELAPLADCAYATAAPNPRAMSPEALAEIIRKATDIKVESFAVPQDALLAAINNASDSDLVVAAGSFYLAGELRKYLREIGYLAGRK